MDKYEQYEEIKSRLNELGMPPEVYEEAIKIIAEVLKL